MQLHSPSSVYEVDFKAPRSFEIHQLRQYQVKFTGLVGIVNTTVYKTEPIFADLEHSKLSYHLTHWGRVTHICVSNLTTIGSVNGLSPGRRQVITWTNAGILLMGPLGTLQWHFNRNCNIFIQENAFESIVCKMTAILSRPQCVNTVMTAGTK